MSRKPAPPAAPVAAVPPRPVLPQSGGAWVLVDDELRPATPPEIPVQTPVEGAD